MVWNKWTLNGESKVVWKKKDILYFSNELVLGYF